MLLSYLGEEGRGPLLTFSTCRLATPADDADLRQILRENPFTGNISLSFEREPSYFAAAEIEGPFHQTMVVCETETGRIMGMGDRSVRPLWVNGEVTNVGYFSGLRARETYRRGLALARFTQQGFSYYQQLHADGRAPFYLISVIADNLPARRLLTSGLKGLPRLREHTRMVTYAIHPARPKRELMSLQRGTPEHIPAIVDCLNRNNARKQFSPVWTKESLLSPLTPHLVIDDFFLAFSGRRLVGCLALWDQQSVRQTVIRGYGGIYQRFRKAINLLAPLGGWPNLPNVGTRLNQCFAAFAAIDGDDPSVFAALLRAVHNEAAKRRYSTLLLALPETDPLRRLVTAYHPLKYISQIYLAAWDDLPDLDSRPPALEIALL